MGHVTLCTQICKRKHTATHCNTLQHTATHCNTLQRTACHTLHANVQTARLCSRMGHVTHVNTSYGICTNKSCHFTHTYNSAMSHVQMSNVVSHVSMSHGGGTQDTKYLFMKVSGEVRDGKDPSDASSCKSIFAKEPWIIGLFCGKWPIRIRYPMGLRHPVVYLCTWAAQAYGRRPIGAYGRRPIGYLILIGHFPQKSPMIHGSFAKIGSGILWVFANRQRRLHFGSSNLLHTVLLADWDSAGNSAQGSDCVDWDVTPLDLHILLLCCTWSHCVVL